MAASPAPLMVELRALKRAWGDFVIDVLALTADEGDYLVILGPSGCGKSLLLGMLAGIFAPDSGRVLLDGRDVTQAAPEKRGLGFVFQKSSLFPHLSVEDNIAFGLRVRGVPRQRRRERTAELVETLKLGDLLKRPTAALSGGEAQKVAIARALAPEPRGLLLDEPLSLVDHNARLELQEELRRIHEQLGLTALHVTHNREEARALGSRCAVMLGGRIVQLGPTKEVFEQPRCLFVSRFLGHEGEAPARPRGCTEACIAGTASCDHPYLGDTTDAL
jgi:ABC-type sugar transport system ATPase subunit